MSNMKTLLESMYNIIAETSEEPEEVIVETIEEVALTESNFARRHYQFVADVIKDKLQSNADVAQAFAEAFQQENPNFNPQKFMMAVSLR